MSTLSEIKRMQKEGKTEPEIIGALKQQGIAPREISESIAQSKIKDAVGGTEDLPTPEEFNQSGVSSQEYQQQQYPEMTSSLSSQEPEPQAQEQPVQEYQEQPQPQYAPEQQGYPPQDQYQGYQQQQTMSTDTITEIAEQAVSEKIVPLRKDLEKIIDLRTTLQARMESLDERLKRIEKVIDRLQLSILQKVGDYATNIEDIKKEIIETQKSFKALMPSTNQERTRKLPSPAKEPSKEFKDLE